MIFLVHLRDVNLVHVHVLAVLGLDFAVYFLPLRVIGLVFGHHVLHLCDDVVCVPGFEALVQLFEVLENVCIVVYAHAGNHNLFMVCGQGVFFLVEEFLVQFFSRT